MILSGNPFECNCDMTWMVSWVNKFKTPSGQHIISDYQEVSCHSGMMAGNPIYKLNEVEMGCYPSVWSTGDKVGVGIGAVLVVMIIVATVLIIRNKKELKFMAYYYLNFNNVPKDEKNENVNNMEYDAYFSFCPEDLDWVKKVFMKEGLEFNLEEDYGFRLIVRERDFNPMRSMIDQITNAIDKSRRIVFILSRNFTKSRWGMEEFMIADAEAVTGRKNLIIIVLIDGELNIDALPEDLKNYMKTHTYIDATKSTKKVVKRLRYSMPHTPIGHLRPGQLGLGFRAFRMFKDPGTPSSTSTSSSHAGEEGAEEPEDNRQDGNGVEERVLVHAPADDGGHPIPLQELRDGNELKNEDDREDTEAEQPHQDFDGTVNGGDGAKVENKMNDDTDSDGDSSEYQGDVEDEADEDVNNDDDSRPIINPMGKLK